MSKLRAAGVPLWVTIIGIILAIFSSVIGIIALVDPSAVSFSAADPVLGRGWAGRNLGLGLAMAAALVLRSRPAYIAAFLGGIGRDLGDLIASIDDGESVVVPIVALAIGAAALAAVVGPMQSETAAPVRSAR